MTVVLACLSGCGQLGVRPSPPAQDGSSLEPTEASKAPEPAFTDATQATGLDFRHANGMAGERWFVEMAGAGVALLDYDRDGDLDVYLVQGGPLEPDPDQPVDRPSDRLFRNDLKVGSDGQATVRFLDVTEDSGIDGATGYGMGVAVGDVNNDGWPDLYLTNFGPNQLWINDGRGGFLDASDRIDNPVDGWSTSATMLDFDLDGDLDIYVANYVRYTLQSDHPCYSTQSGVRDYCGPSAYPPALDVLLRNRGDGSFEDATYTMGLTEASGPGLGVVSADLDADGWPDVYVANDGADNQLWMNRAGRRFEDRATFTGSAVNSLGSPEASMGIAPADFDNDGDVDLFLTHLRRESNTLYVNDGQAMFQDVTQRSGLERPSIPFTGFGVAAVDFDNDGWRDLIVTNGLVVLDLEQLAAGDDLPLRATDQVFQNVGQARFEEVSATAGAAFQRPTVGRGLAAGDLDNDGDADLILTENNGPATVLFNVRGASRDWIGFDVRLARDGRQAYGAQVELRANGEILAMRHVQSDGSYLSASDARPLFGLGELTAIDRIRVRWPDGSLAEWQDLSPGRYHQLLPGEGRPLSRSGGDP